MSKKVLRYNCIKRKNELYYWSVHGQLKKRNICDNIIMFLRIIIEGESMYSKSSHSWLKHWDFILLDIICLEVSFFVAFLIRQGVPTAWSISMYRSEATILFVCQLLTVFFRNSFSGILKRGYYLEFSGTIKHAVCVMAFTLLILFITKETGTYSRVVLVITGCLYVVTGYVSRMTLKYFVRKSAGKKGKSSLVIVTTVGKAEQVMAQLEESAYQQYLIKGICLLDGDAEQTKIKEYPVMGNGETFVEYVCREWVDEVMFLLPHDVAVPKELLETLTLMGITTHVPISRHRVKGSKQFVEEFGEQTVLTTSINIVEVRQVFYKRFLDIVGGIVGCMITLVLIIILGPIIYIKSPGPIFFSQMRIGKNGRKFKIYKFRSMYMDAEERKKELMSQNKMDGFMFKMDYDPRIIGCEKIGKDGKPKGIGNFIRSTSLDEFPQFWNVLKGDMSLVGTRPPTLDEWEKYEPHHRARMAIKPGITGMWQVSGRSDITDFEEVVRLDTEYIEKWNFGLDIKIILMTVLQVLKSDGAV